MELLALGPLVIPLIMAASSIASGIIAHNQNKKTNQANMKLAEYQAGANERYLDKMNQYNTPANQMSRFSEAGLNPNLVYGQGSSGNQQTAARYEAPRVDYRFDPFDMPQVLAPFQEYQMRAAQIDNVKASTEATRTEIGNKLLNRLLTATNTSRKEFDLEQARKLAPYNAQIRKGEADATFTKLLREFEKTTGVQIQNMLNVSRKELVDRQWEGQGLQNFYNEHRNILIRRGITTSDHPAVRIMYMMMHNSGATFNQNKLKRDLRITD